MAFHFIVDDQISLIKQITKTMMTNASVKKSIPLNLQDEAPANFSGLIWNICSAAGFIDAQISKAT